MTTQDIAMATDDTELSHLADAVRAGLRARFLRAVSTGESIPLVLPYCALGVFVVPALWLAVPHTKRPWLYQTRWLVAVFVIVFNLHVTRTASSSNMAGSYGAGLMAMWGTLLNLELLVWTRPQFEAARAMRVPKKRKLEGSNGSAGQSAADYLVPNGLRKRKPVAEGVDSKEDQDDDSRVMTNEDDGFEYVWQSFPAEAPFLERLNWAVDLTCSFRGSGWNWSISSVPRPEIPQNIHSGLPVTFDSMPQVTRSGYSYCLSEPEFVFNRLRIVAVTYLALDFLAINMMRDPYFILGPSYSYPLPPHLRDRPAWLLLLYRETLSLAGMLSAILAIFSVSDLAQHWLLRRFFPARGALWQYASTFGGFSHVVDRGLAGFWGAFWHQTFRRQFMAPSTYLLKRGYILKGTSAATLTALFVSFFQSGLLHASGSASSIPSTKIWRAPAFFILQAVGIVIQTSLTTALKPYMPLSTKSSVMAPLSRCANLLFTLAWLSLTARFFIDDIASTGLWLLEPVPISPLRWLGLGAAEDHWWRWDREHFPKWYDGLRWWQCGVAI